MSYGTYYLNIVPFQIVVTDLSGAARTFYMFFL